MVPVRAAAGSGAAQGAGADERRGWELAQWAVARADTLRITEVAYRDRVWRAGESGGGWSKVSGARVSGSPEGAPESSGAPAQGGETVRMRLAK